VAFNLPSRKTILNVNILQIQPHVRKLNYFRFSDAILNFGVKESSDKVSMWTVEKLTLENMGITFGILSLGGTEPEIHLGGHLPSPSQLQRSFKKYHWNIRFNPNRVIISSLLCFWWVTQPVASFRLSRSTCNLLRQQQTTIFSDGRSWFSRFW